MAETLEQLSARMDRLEFEAAAAQVRYSMRETMAAINDGVLFVTLTPPGRILACNSAFERMFCYAESEIIGQSVEVLMPERFREKHQTHRLEYMAHPEIRPMGGRIGMTLFGRTKTGDEKRLGISLTPMVILVANS